MWVISIIGIATALLAGSIAIFQNDIKKILAYSTVSQLGLMFVALGAGSFTAAMFHLTTHAFFKALLFLAAGSVIHALSGEQNILKMGGLRHKIPVTFWVFLIGSLAISGIPPFAGFFSKDMILVGAFENSPLLWAVSVLVALMTSFYIFRLLFVVFWGEARQKEDHHHPVHESPKTMTVPMMILAGLSVVGGLIGVPHLLGGSDRILEYLSPIFAASTALKSATHEISVQTEWLLLIVPLLLILGMIYLAYSMFVKKPVADDLKQKSFIERLIYNKFYIDEHYQVFILQPISKLSVFFHDVIEVKIIDRFVNNIGKTVVWTGKNIRYMQTGNVGVYLFFMVISIILILFFNLFN
jgi:NADH-quinone oxidoreductase subunit L